MKRIVGGFQAFGLGLVVSACAHPGLEEGPLVAQVGRIQVQLPPELASWTPAIHQAIAKTEQEWHALSRWPVQAVSYPSLRLHVFRDPQAAAVYFLERGFSGDPAVARTFLQARLASVPLPRADNALIQRRHPPATWLQTLRHEIAHLLALDSRTLGQAPLWFQEGLAESLAGTLPPPWSESGWARFCLEGHRAEDSLAKVVSTLDADTRLQVWRLQVEWALTQSGRTPWLGLENWTVRDWLQMTSLHPSSWPLVAGRDFDPPSTTQPMLLAAYPGRSVVVTVREAWNGDALRLRARLGLSGRPEAGIFLRGAGNSGVRSRLGRRGGSSVSLEELGVLDSLPLRGEVAGAPLGQALVATLRIRNGVLEVIVGERSSHLPLQAGLMAPFRIEAQVSDGLLLLAEAGS